MCLVVSKKKPAAVATFAATKLGKVQLNGYKFKAQD